MKYAAKPQSMNPSMPQGANPDSIWMKIQIADELVTDYQIDGWTVSGSDNFMDLFINRANDLKSRDYNKYIKRATARSKIIAEMASENMDRVRKGIWTVPQLIGLTQDPDLKNVLDDVNTLSFELAAMKIGTSTNPLLTPEIKSGWISKLASNFFNGG